MKSNTSEPIYYLHDNIGRVELINVSGNDLAVVNAAKVSFNNQAEEMSEKEIKLLKYLADNQHLSPFEMSQFTFRIKAPLFVIQQILRHRMSSFNQVSHRYVEIEEEFYIPIQFRLQSKSNKQASGDNVDFKHNLSAIQDYRVAIETSLRIYKSLIQSGVAREMARGVLPTATYSEILYTANFRSLLNFLQLRLDKHAQIEIQKLAQAILKLVKDDGSFKETLRVFGLS